jgi:hypothetical protein
VQLNSDGTFWTGTWVVDKEHATKGLELGAYVALHKNRSELSYRQGIIVDWRRSERENSYADGQETKTRYGIDFLVQPADGRFAWCGDATGEKGYFYGDLAIEDDTPVAA